MRHIIALIVLVVLGLIALKLLFWTLKHVVLLAVVGGGVYLLLNSGLLKKKS